MDRRKRRLGWSAGNPMDYFADSRVPSGKESVWSGDDRYTKGRINWAITPETQQRERSLRDMLSGTGVPDWGNAAYGKTNEDTRKLQAMSSMFNAAAHPAGTQPVVKPLSEYKLSDNRAIGNAYAASARDMNQQAAVAAGLQAQELAKQEAELQANQQAAIQNAMQAKAAQQQAIAEAQAEEERRKQAALGRFIVGGV